jgi:PAS domain S-box-containing protein
MVQTSKKNQANNLSEEFLKTMFSQAGDGIFLVENQKIVVANPRGCEMFGFSEDEIIGLPLMEYVPADEIEHITTKLGLLATTKFVVSESAFYRKDGSRMNVEISGRMLSNGQILGLMRDITERKQAEKALQFAQNKIREDERVMAAYEERERVARELHDGIGQTFGYINMQSDAIRELVSQGDGDQALRMLAALSEVAQESHRDLRNYIQGLKSHSGAIHQEFFSALQRYCRQYEESYLFHVQLNLPDTLPLVLASAQVETHLTYIIREALSNARRYSGEKDVRLTIKVDDKFIQAIVEDHGVGFEYLGPERRKGSHFGMTIMSERAEQVGGSVEVESAPSKGTRVTVRLPRNLSTEGALIARVLLVDDHPLFMDGLRNMLVARGVRVIGIARDGLEAHEMARSLRPDIILMDINMPRMSGLEATRLIKADLPEVKVAILTTSLADEDILEALKVGASGYFPKGMAADEFMERLAEIARGEAEFSAEVARKLLENFSQKTAEMVQLSERQVEILRLVGRGLTYREIGDRLYLTERTVKYHMGEILTRLHLKKREDAKNYARRRGLA